MIVTSSPQNDISVLYWKCFIFLIANLKVLEGDSPSWDLFWILPIRIHMENYEFSHALSQDKSCFPKGKAPRPFQRVNRSKNQLAFIFHIIMQLLSARIIHLRCQMWTFLVYRVIQAGVEVDKPRKTKTSVSVHALGFLKENRTHKVNNVWMSSEWQASSQNKLKYCLLLVGKWRQGIMYAGFTVYKLNEITWKLFSLFMHYRNVCLPSVTLFLPA